VLAEAPTIVRDRLIYGEVYSLIPLEAAWCRGYMMLQIEERSLRRLQSHQLGDNRVLSIVTRFAPSTMCSPKPPT
jgi:hypothetical protein